VSKFCFVTLCFAAAFLLFPIIVFGQTHFSFKKNTGENYSILIRTATFNGAALAPGDEVGVFTSAGLCVGATIVSQSTNIPLVAWQDDPLTIATDGYADRDTMRFRFWRAGTQTEHQANAAYLLGDGTFGNGPYAFVDLSATFNFTPVMSPPAKISFNEDTVFELLLDTIVSDANDADALLQWQFICGPNLTAQLTANRLLRLTPAQNWFGQDTCTFIVTDPGGASDTAKVAIEVASVNDLPVLQLPTTPIAIDEDDTTRVLALDEFVTDVESADPLLVWTVTPDPKIAVRFDVARRQIRLVPALNFNGNGRIGLSVKDPDNGMASGNLQIVVRPVPDRPAAARLIRPIGGETVTTLNPVLRWQAAIDPDGDKLRYRVIIDTSPTLTTAPDTSSSIDTTFFKVLGGIKPDQHYYWRVMVSDGFFPFVASVIDSFYTSKDAKPDTTLAVKNGTKIPTRFVLDQNFPNPFSLSNDGAATHIHFVLPKPAAVSLRIYNALGQLVRELFHGAQPAGLQQLVWDGRDENGRRVSGGLYWLRLESQEFVATRKILVIP
jgi:hypothetical protein